MNLPLDIRRQVWVFTALLSLLPGLADYSFFTLGAIDLLPGEVTYWTGLHSGGTILPAWIYWLLALMTVLSIGLMMGVGKLLRRGWALVAASLVLLEWLFPLLLGELDFYGQMAVTAAQWMAFIYFLVSGRMRSWAFLAFVALLFFCLPFAQVMLFVMVAGLGRIIEVFLTQNYNIVRRSAPSHLLRLLGRTLLLWSPILLFAIPQIYLTRTLRNFATETMYEVGLVEHYHITEETTLDNLAAQLTDTASFIPNALLERELTADSLPRLLEHLRYALVYAFEKSDSLRQTKAVVPAFEYAVAALEPGLNPSTPTRAAVDTVGYRLDLVARRHTLVGVNEFQMDTELTLQDIFRDRENQLNARLDSIDRVVNENVEASLDSIDQNLSATSGDLKADFLAERQRIEQSTDRQFNALERQTNLTFKETFPPRLTQISPRFGPSDCGFPGIKCRAINGMKSLLRGIYFEERPKLIAGVERKAAASKAAARQKVRAELDHVQDGLFRRIDQGATSIDAYKDSLRVISRTTSEAVAEARGGAANSVSFLNESVRNGMWSLQRYLYTLRLISTVIFFFLIIASFMYVFSRVAFAEGTSYFMTLRRGDSTAKPSAPLPHGAEYTIPADHQKTFYVSKKYVPTGRAPKLAIPQWTASIGRRLMTGTYFMNAVSVRPDNREPVDFRSTAGAEFAEWLLDEGQEVIFMYDHLVAFTEGIRLRSHFSLRLTTLLVGRPFFYIARGPGRLVLQTKGKPIISGEEKVIRSVSTERLVAWQRPVQFSVQSETNLIDIYFSSLYLQRDSEEFVLIDADDGRTKRKTGLARFVLRFLLPI